MDRYVVSITRAKVSKSDDFKIPKYISDIYAEEVILKKAYKDFNLSVSYFRNKHNPLPPLFFEDQTSWYILSGYVIEPISNDNIGKYFTSDESNCRPVKTSLGGIYSYTSIRKVDGNVSTGQSLPAWEPIFYSKDNNDVVLGNNPLLTHLYAKRTNTPIMRDDYFVEALQGGGVACGETTPFDGCLKLLASKQLVFNAKDKFELKDVDSPSFGNHSTSGINNRVNAFVDCLNYSSTIFKKLLPPQFQISGGRDSRLLAAMFKANDIEIIPETKSTYSGASGKIADLVAQTLGYDECVRDLDRTFPEDEHFHDLAIEKIRYQSGLPSIASPQYSSRLGGHQPGHPMVYGHAHLQRGGLRPIKRVADAKDIIFERMLNPCLSDAVRKKPESELTNYIDEKSGGLKYIQALSQHFYFDYTMAYQYPPFQSYMANWHTPVMPLMDERFSLYCLELASAESKKWSWPFNRNAVSEFAGIVDLHSDRIVMEATYKMAPELLSFPLESGRYRIEKVQPFASSGTAASYDLRDPALIKQFKSAKDPAPRAYYPHIDTVASYVWDYLEQVGMRDAFCEVTRSDVIDYVSDPTSGLPSSIAPSQVSAHIWSAFGLAIILKSDWWN